MSDEALEAGIARNPQSIQAGAVRERPNRVVAYAASLGLVGVAAVAAFIVENIVPTSNLALVFVLPVLVAAVSFGWGPALASALAAVATFDFFFVEPRFSLRVTSPSDMWAMALLLVVAAIASTVAAQSRRRAIDSRLAADRAEALHDLAHLVVEAAPAAAVAEAAAMALARIFQAPAAVLLESGEALRPVALAGGATLSATDTEAARWSLSNQLPTRAETFPFDAAEFDFWPFRRGDGPGIVLGVDLTKARDGAPADPSRHIELVGAYLAAALSQKSPTPSGLEPSPAA